MSFLYICAYLAHTAFGVRPTVTASNGPSESHVQRLSTWREAFDHDPDLFKGCSKVFLDVGSNRGTHVRKLFEPDKYPGCPYLGVFDDAFGSFRSGPSSETGICAFGFEANPRWASRLQEIENDYGQQGWRAKWFAPAAVGSEAGDLTFWRNDKPEDQKSNWSFSMHKLHDYSQPVKVPVDDLSAFVQELNTRAASGYRLMKMDIEGSEFVVLPKFLENRLLCTNAINKITIEWHEFVLSKDKKQAGIQTREQVMNPSKFPSKCDGVPSTEVVDFDDESFLNDGVPLPSVSYTLTDYLWHLVYLAISPFRRFFWTY